MKEEFEKTRKVENNYESEKYLNVIIEFHLNQKKNNHLYHVSVFSNFRW